MRLRNRMASNNVMTDDQVAESIVENSIINENGYILGLLMDPYFDLRVKDGKVIFSGKFQHLEIDENTVDLIHEGLASKIEKIAKGTKGFEEKVKENIKNIVSNPNHFNSEDFKKIFLNPINELIITDIDVYVTEKRYLQMYTDSAMVTFYIKMETM
jgi:hypothetical protein